MIQWQPGIIQEPVEPCPYDHAGAFGIPGAVGKRVWVRPAVEPNVQDALPCELEIQDVAAWQFESLGYEPTPGMVLVVCRHAVATD